MQGPGDPYWLADDADKAIAYEQWLHLFCKQCGTRFDEWTDAIVDEETGETHERPKYPPPYEPEQFTCPGCFDLDRMRDANSNSKKVDTRGMHYYLKPFDPEEAEIVAESVSGNGVS